MKILVSSFLLFLSISALAESLEESDLIGFWSPSGQMPRESGVQNYTLEITHDLTARYISLDESIELECSYKQSTSQTSIFVYYCYFDGKHLITLSLGGWNLEPAAQMLFGYEYWLGFPSPGHIHGGLPVSLIKE